MVNLITIAGWYSSPEWVLVLVGAITFLVIGWQAYESRRAASAAQIAAIAASDNAVAAKIQAEALQASERAWIHGDFVPRQIMSDIIRYSLTITNQGKTPAQVSGYEISHGLVTEGVPFSKDSLTSHFSDSKQLFIGAGETQSLRDDFNLNDLFTLESGDAAASHGMSTGAFCVTINYSDVVSRGPQRQTSFVYLVNLTFSTITRTAQNNEYT